MFQEYLKTSNTIQYNLTSRDTPMKALNKRTSKGDIMMSRQQTSGDIMMSRQHTSGDIIMSRQRCSGGHYDEGASVFRELSTENSSENIMTKDHLSSWDSMTRKLLSSRDTLMRELLWSGDTLMRDLSSGGTFMWATCCMIYVSPLYNPLLLSQIKNNTQHCLHRCT